VTTLCFDLDGTLCTNTGGDYDQARPFAWAIARVNRLAAEGHRIVIFTARGTATGIDWSEVTQRQLDGWGVSYDALHFGKPSAAVYIDDRAVHTEAWRRGSAFGPPALAPPEGEAEVLPTVLPPSVSAVVEAGRTFAGRPLRVEDHVRRLLARAERAGIELLPSAAEVRALVAESLEGHGEGEVRYSICLSDPPRFADLEALASGGSPRLSVWLRPLAETHAALAAMTVEPAGDGRPTRVRTEIADRADPGPAPAAWPLHPSTGGGLSAGLGARLGLVGAEGEPLVLEPRPGGPDVASGWLAELAGAAGLRVEERPITPDELDRADAFLVGEPYCLLSVLPPSGVVQAPASGVLDRLWEAWEQAAGSALSIAADPSAALIASAGAPGQDE
jgi:hypothetical protein